MNPYEQIYDVDLSKGITQKDIGTLVFEGDNNSIKVGSNVLTRTDGKLDVTRVSAFVDQIAWLRKQGIEVILVSSGAVACGRQELRVDHLDLAVLPRAVEADELRGNGAGMLERGALADARIALHDVEAAVLEIRLALAADDEVVRRLPVVSERMRRLAGIRGIRARESLVRRDDEHEAAAVRVTLEQRMREISARVRRDLADDLGDLARVGRVGVRGFLGVTQAARRNHVHSARDLLGARNTLDAMADVL